MFERGNLTTEQAEEIETRFDESKKWWRGMVDSRLAARTDFFVEVFDSP